MLFRYTFIRMVDIIKLLDNDFNDVFEFENIIPAFEAMVRDTKYNWNFHSAMRSNGSGQFNLPDDELRKLFRIERVKIHSQINILKQRLGQGNVVCVHVADDITDAAAQILLDAIDARAENRLNKLLVVGKPHGAKNEIGQCYEIGERAFRGVVAQLAPFSRAGDADFPSWGKVLSAFRAEA